MEGACKASPSVTILNVSMVEPSSPTAHHTDFLADVDIILMSAPPSRRIIFYKLPEHMHVVSDYPSLVRSLKSSLSLALVHYYPWSGRLCICPQGNLALNCNDAGVEFVEAFVDMPFASLEADEFQVTPLFHQLVPQTDPAFGKSTQLDLPVLSVQVTRFSQGGMALGFAQSHVIADGISFWSFVKAWTECNKGMPVSSPPLHMRTTLARENLISSCELGPCRRVVDMPVRANDNIVVQRTFQFSRDVIQELKSITCKEGGGRFTSFEVLCAHVWRQMVAARAPTDAQQVALMIPLDARRRLMPPLPVNYFGNAVILGGVFAQAREVKGESLWRTARRIHETIASWGDKKCRKQLASMEHELDKVTSDVGTVVMVGGSSKFAVYETDFGWGKPCAVKFLCFLNDSMILQGGRQEGFVEVSVASSPACMDVLQRSLLFLPSN